MCTFACRYILSVFFTNRLIPSLNKMSTMSKSSLMPIRIGVLYSESGVTSAVERTQQRATALAVEEINAAGGVLGREIELVYRDPACNASRYAGLTEELIVEKSVRLIMGCYMSST